jgi:hypothetical protein
MKITLYQPKHETTTAELKKENVTHHIPRTQPNPTQPNTNKQTRPNQTKPINQQKNQTNQNERYRSLPAHDVAWEAYDVRVLVMWVRRLLVTRN